MIKALENSNSQNPVILAVACGMSNAFWGKKKANAHQMKASQPSAESSAPCKFFLVQHPAIQMCSYSLKKIHVVVVVSRGRSSAPHWQLQIHLR